MHMQGLPWWANWTLQLWTGTSILFRWASGALVVCRSDAFRDVGGFNQELYAADEIGLSETAQAVGAATRPSIHHLEHSIRWRHHRARWHSTPGERLPVRSCESFSTHVGHCKTRSSYRFGMMEGVESTHDPTRATAARSCHLIFRGAWRRSGLSGWSSLSSLFGSTNSESPFTSRRRHRPARPEKVE